MATSCSPSFLCCHDNTILTAGKALNLLKLCSPKVCDINTLTKFIFPHNNFLVYTLNIIQCHNTAPTVQWRSECSETEATLEC